RGKAAEEVRYSGGSSGQKNPSPGAGNKKPGSATGGRGRYEEGHGGWVIGHGLCLAMMKCAESLEMRQAFVDVVSAGVAKGMIEGLKHGVEHGQTQLKVKSIEAYDPEAEA
nr:hypothetical protein [Tanacetum cinerariifolium]